MGGVSHRYAGQGLHLGDGAGRLCDAALSWCHWLDFAGGAQFRLDQSGMACRDRRARSVDECLYLRRACFCDCAAFLPAGVYFRQIRAGFDFLRNGGRGEYHGRWHLDHHAQGNAALGMAFHPGGLYSDFPGNNCAFRHARHYRHSRAYQRGDHAALAVF